MPDKHRERVLDTDGPAAPPRLNGELVFAAPWESRVFGIAVALHSQGVFEWDEFRDCLIAEIAGWERQHGREANAQWSYYSRWLAALETLLVRKGLCAPADVTTREREFADRPAGHDH
jgi:nitrile hydratase accessory protein